MRKRSSSLGRLLTLLCCLWGQWGLVRAADFVVSSRDDVLILASKIQATQFLTHATFGPTQLEVDTLASRMRAIGTIAAAAEWIEAQTNASTTPPSLHVARQEQMIVDDYPTWTITPAGAINTTHAYYPPRYRQYAWWHNVIAGQDQLRQKTAWALAQIFPVNQYAGNFNDDAYDSTVVNGPQKSRYLGLSHFYDIFVANAFGKFRDILGKVTYHPVMGDWLSYRGNRRAQGGEFPDENFAREVMQLFTIGLYVLDDDGVHQKTLGVSTPTYNANDIREYAQVFTGLGYGYGTYAPTNSSLNPYSPYTGTLSTEPNSFVKYFVPMRMAPSQHDRSSKNLLNSVSIANPNGNNIVHTEATANADIAAALDGLVAHQSCPPFIVRRLIQRLVKSNPSRAYTSRVVSEFKGTGASDRGDLKRVIKAILLDPEAWQPIRVQYQRSPINKFIVSTMGTEDSRLQEPILNYIRFTRFFKAVAAYQKATGGSFDSPSLLKNEFRLGSLNYEFEQSPYEMPSVFNFYLADYQAGELVNYVPSSRIPNGIVAVPELKLVNAITCNNIGNFFRDRVYSAERIEGVQYKDDESTNSDSVKTTILESTRTLVTYDFSAEQALVVNSTSVERLIERLDLYLCGGTLNSQFKSTLRTAVLQEIANAGGVGRISSDEALDIAKGAILGIVSAPSYLVTK